MTATIALVHLLWIVPLVAGMAWWAARRHGRDHGRPTDGSAAGASAEPRPPRDPDVAWHGALVEAEPGPALLVDRDTRRLVVANEVARRDLNVDVSPEPPTLLRAVGSAAVSGAAERVAETGEAIQLDAEIGARHHRVAISPVGDLLLVLLQDRTEQHRVEAVRRDFVVAASHELKTPAAGIQALVDALDHVVDTPDERVTGLIARLRDESARLTALVHDLLDLRRLDETASPDAVRVLDLAVVAQEVVDGVRQAAEDADVTLELDAPPALPFAGIEGDLRLALTNLLTNGVTYNRPGGRVSLRVRRGDGEAVLTVEDDGIGIATQHLDRIFERFYRVDADRSRSGGGTGLGLSLVRHAVERHGGTIAVESLLGAGTTITVRLPVTSG